MITFDVAVFRFTPHVARHRELLELIGLRAELISESGHYVELRGARGRVHLHEGDPATTELHLFVDAIADAEQTLQHAGVECRVWDESFGHMMQVPGPHGAWVHVVERQHDPYGYQPLDATGARGEVAAVWYTRDMTADAAAFAPYGFAPAGPVDEWWTELRAGEGSGTIGLHRAEDDAQVTTVATACDYTLTVTEDLDALRARLDAAGWETSSFRDEFISYVGVTDPDGRQLQIHAAHGA